MEEDSLTAISNALDTLMGGTEDPREVLADLVREHGPEQTVQVARIVFGSWRTRVDQVESVLNDILAEHRGSDS